jgi:DNA-binding transcriptional MerR regulator
LGSVNADKSADNIRRSSIAGAVAMVRNTRPALRRCREESGYSLAQIIERCDTLKEASLQSGVSYRTVRRYARRWGIE